jgi:invasion protein IalB
MTHRIAFVPARVLATLTAAAILAVAAATPALSQQQQPAASKPAAPAQQKPATKSAAPVAQKGQQPAAPGVPAAQQSDQQIPNLVYSSWTKICRKAADANAKSVCQVGREGRMESGLHVVSAVVIEMEGEAKKVLQLTLPQGVLLPRGTRVIVDSDEQQAIVGTFLVCANGGCVAQLEANADTVARLKKGQQLFIQAYDMQQKVMTLSLPLGDFAKAYDGPATDAKVFEEQQKKLQGELQLRAQKAREELEKKQGQAPGKTQ